MAQQKQEHKSDAIEVQLEIPTVFKDLNEKEGKDIGFKRTSIQVSRLKFKHLKKMQALTEDEQTMYALTMLTNLSESDLDELDAVDSANIMNVVYGFMENFFKLANKIAGSSSS